MNELKMYGNPSPTDASLLDVGVGPHCRVGQGLAEIYQRWVIALIPAMLASWFFFGADSLRVLGMCVAFSVAIDFICEKLSPSRDLTSNWSSVSLALLMGFMMPVNAPWWLILIGCFLMIVLGKKFFGGVGAYPAQPAVLAIAIMQLSWPSRMDYTAALKDMDWSVNMVEPLKLYKSIGSTAAEQYGFFEMLFGYQVSGVACGMVFFILLGGAYLFYTREISWHAPVGFLAGIVVTAGIFHMLYPEWFASPVFYLLSGGTVFMGLFLLTDHTNCPVNPTPLILYGVLAGILLVFIRGFSKHVDGIAYAVLLVNLCAPLLDMIKPKIKGAGNE